MNFKKWTKINILRKKVPKNEIGLFNHIKLFIIITNTKQANKHFESLLLSLQLKNKKYQAIKILRTELSTTANSWKTRQ